MRRLPYIFFKRGLSRPRDIPFLQLSPYLLRRGKACHLRADGWPYQPPGRRPAMICQIIAHLFHNKEFV